MALTLNANAAEYVPPSTSTQGLEVKIRHDSTVGLGEQRRKARNARRGKQQKEMWAQQQMALAQQQHWAAACWAAYQQAAAMGYNYRYPGGGSDDELDEEVRSKGSVLSQGSLCTVQKMRGSFFK
ncbi:hypothetical protein DUNSADRAFT_15019 [Dunaliella salina]|uniref:Uncharacterized protein n=1 Tax=Dunaliella salina TaxID=3046 RepID=A0ABQ7G6B6_DUNSA|nr:hypothetical protein DUNSADRAFT_15019 [Dunaliella salina]|eukprot:KAF5830128.1 hypothetical protein DUNSADRAFT_15019 [Dunaliella salina]